MSQSKVRRRPLATVSRAIVGMLLGATLAFAPATAAAQGNAPAPPVFRPFNVLPMTIASVGLNQTGQLVANAVIGTQSFELPISLSASPAQGGAACPILNLELQAITLNVLGLVVETSDICLDITAHSDQGLLGSLLCSLAGDLLNTGLSGPTLWAGLDATEQTVLSNALTTALNQAVFIPITSSPALIGASCEILNLALGPVDLTLLGLQVELDNCANPPGPITVDISAVPGGGLLGDLLCSLSNALNNPFQRLAILRQIARIIGMIVGGFA